jgi:predicted nuclease of predicted toxin-antitoxin system
MKFLLDENVPVLVADMLKAEGHDAVFVRDYVPPGAPDPLVATMLIRLLPIDTIPGPYPRAAMR